MGRQLHVLFPSSRGNKDIIMAVDYVSQLRKGNCYKEQWC